MSAPASAAVSASATFVTPQILTLTLMLREQHSTSVAKAQLRSAAGGGGAWPSPAATTGNERTVENFSAARTNLIAAPEDGRTPLITISTGRMMPWSFGEHAQK